MVWSRCIYRTLTDKLALHNLTDEGRRRLKVANRSSDLTKLWPDHAVAGP